MESIDSGPQFNISLIKRPVKINFMNVSVTVQAETTLGGLAVMSGIESCTFRSKGRRLNRLTILL